MVVEGAWLSYPIPYLMPLPSESMKLLFAPLALPGDRFCDNKPLWLSLARSLVHLLVPMPRGVLSLP